MNPLSSFSSFFEALWRPHGPFPWQEMLAERIMTDRWPQALDLPTASGKTACIDAAIYALAQQADRPVAARTAPRRIWFVVDRRIVVDEAFERACKIARKLEDAGEGPLKEVADRLRAISGTDRALAVARLRGGVLRDDGWARLPSQPAVITSTVDQLGSRILFRGYGSSHLAAPIFAGLAAHDSLILLDEAHCSVPFLQTLRSIESYRGEAWAEFPVRTPFAFVILSATPPLDISKARIFPGEGRKRALDHPVLHARLKASKAAELVTLKTKANQVDPLVAEAIKRARSYTKTEGKRRVGVVVNRVKTAEQIANTLRDQAKGELEVILLTGRIRPYERDQLVEKWKPVLRAASPDEWDRPVVLVSTQCIEVGADFSFDALVTEAASLDALRQRFGRLNRMGLPGVSPAAILVRDRDAKASGGDPIYGEAIQECWNLLSGKANDLPRGKEEVRIIDFGFEHLDSVLSDVEDLSVYLAPRPNAPTLLPSHLDLLCQTAPTPAVEPDVQLFLHGYERVSPEVRILWRCDLNDSDPNTWGETVALCPPNVGEMLSVPLQRFRTWLANHDAAGEAEDVEGVAFETEDGPEGIRPVLVWRGRDHSKIARTKSEIIPNDVVVLPTEYGLSGVGESAPHQALGEPPLDVWEPSRRESGKPRSLRIHRAVLRPWMDCGPIKSLVELAEQPAWEREDLEGAIETVQAYQPDSAEAPFAPPDWIRDLLETTRSGRFESHPGGGVVLFEKAPKRPAESDLFADDDDLLSGSNQEVPLTEHTRLVVRTAERNAGRCLPDDVCKPLRLAAQWHDLGKLDERFQVLLRRGNEFEAISSEPLAKSATVPVSPARRNAIRDASGLPANFRHEMLSAQLVERRAELPDDHRSTDLILHLVESHHGHARPFAPVSLDAAPTDLSARWNGNLVELCADERARLVSPHQSGSGVSERFWQLNRRYGWWGLAYLEALLRLSDWYASEHPLKVEQDKLAESSLGSAKRVSPVGLDGEKKPLVLTGLDGANPLGFLTALGVLVALQQDSHPRARLSWRRSAIWQPVLTNLSETDERSLCADISAALRGKTVTIDAENKRKESQAAVDAAKKILKDKRDEIKKRGLRGKERNEAFEAELRPLEDDLHQRRGAWLKALKEAVPRTELALGRHIDCTAEEFHEHAAGILEGASLDNREALDLLASFASDACVNRGKVAATPFCFITGSGHQYFLETVRQLMDVVSPERIYTALFEPWKYGDEKLSMRWDPSEDRRYALLDRDPTASDNKSRTVWMANLLAYRALVLFPSAPKRERLATTGWRRDKDGQSFTWPMWEHPIAIETIRSLMLQRELYDETPNREILRGRGIVAAFRSRRIQVGNPPLYKINFSPSRAV